jgi:hypothetical protein
MRALIRARRPARHSEHTFPIWKCRLHTPGGFGRLATDRPDITPQNWADVAGRGID